MIYCNSSIQSALKGDQTDNCPLDTDTPPVPQTQLAAVLPSAPATAMISALRRLVGGDPLGWVEVSPLTAHSALVPIRKRKEPGAYASSSLLLLLLEDFYVLGVRW